MLGYIIIIVLAVVLIALGVMIAKQHKIKKWKKALYITGLIVTLTICLATTFRVYITEFIGRIFYTPPIGLPEEFFE